MSSGDFRVVRGRECVPSFQRLETETLGVVAFTDYFLW